MVVNEKQFDVSTSYLDTHNQLRSFAGSASWFTEFCPLRFPAEETIHRLLFEFYCHGLCCFLTGTFVYCAAGILNSFRAAALFIALMDTPLIRLIFQRGPGTIQNFSIKAFGFTLMQSVPEEDIFIYHVTNGYFCMLIFFLGMDTSYGCDYRSSVDFVHLIRENLEQFSIKKYAITLLPSEDAPTPPRLPYASPTDTRLLCLKYYRAASDGRRDSGSCDKCVNDYRLSLQPLSGCHQPYPCNCIICRWQPPSLRVLCSNSFPWCHTFWIDCQRVWSVCVCRQVKLCAPTETTPSQISLHPPLVLTPSSTNSTAIVPV